MSKDCIVILLRPHSMRLFRKEQSHDAFVDIEYKGQSIIELNFDVSGNDVLIGEERNPNNYSGYINPISSISKKEYNKAGLNQPNVELLVDAIRKILQEHHALAKKSTIFSTSMARSLLCIVFDLGIEANTIEIVQKRIKNEPFAGVVFHTTIDEYYESIPRTSKTQILINSVGSDLYYFYQNATKIKQRKLESVAFNPLIEVVAQEIFHFIDRSNSHLTFDYVKEKHHFLFEAQKIVAKNQPINLGEVQLSNGRIFEYQIYLAQCKSKAEQSGETALIIREIISIAAEIGIDESDLSLYYSGKNISNYYFESLFSNSVAEVQHIEDFNALPLQLKYAREKLDNFTFESRGNTLEPQKVVKSEQLASTNTVNVSDINSEQLSSSFTTLTSPKPTVVNNASLSSSPPPKVNVEVPSPRPTMEAAAGSLKGAGSAMGRKLPPPPPPPNIKGTGSPKKQTGAISKITPPPPPPPKGPSNVKKKAVSVVNTKVPPPPPPPPAPPSNSIGQSSVKKQVAAKGKLKMPPPPPPPPKIK